MRTASKYGYNGDTALIDVMHITDAVELALMLKEALDAGLIPIDSAEIAESYEKINRVVGEYNERIIARLRRTHYYHHH